MPSAGQIVLFRFPQTDLVQGKLRPALLLCQLPGPYSDWLVCMLSTQLRHYVEGFDEIIQVGDADFEASGLNATSVVRVGRLAVVEEDMLLGVTGEIDEQRLEPVKARLITWLAQD